MRKIPILLTVVVALTGFAAAQSGPSTNLDLEVMQTEPAPLQAGEYATVWVRATNTGDSTATNPQFRLMDRFPFTPSDRTEWTPPGELGPGESYDMRIEVKVSENAAFGNNSLAIEKTSGNQNTWIRDEISVEVRTDDRSLIISELDFPEKVEPGSSAEMQMTLESRDSSNFRNVDVNLLTEELPVAPRETSRKRLTSVEPDSPENISFILDVDDDADNELHDLTIQLDYQNQGGQELSTTETTGIHIGGEPNIDVAIEDSDIRSPGRGAVTFRILNKGEGQARFAEIELEKSEEYEILSENSIYLGSMIADDFQTAEFELYVEEEETLDMPVRVEYRDGTGDHVSDFNIERTLYSSDDLRRLGLDQSQSYWIVVPVLIVLGAAGFYLYRKRY